MDCVRRSIQGSIVPDALPSQCRDKHCHPVLGQDHSLDVSECVHCMTCLDAHNTYQLGACSGSEVKKFYDGLKHLESVDQQMKMLEVCIQTPFFIIMDDLWQPALCLFSREQRNSRRSAWLTGVVRKYLKHPLYQLVQPTRDKDECKSKYDVNREYFPLRVNFYVSPPLQLAYIWFSSLQGLQDQNAIYTMYLPGPKRGNHFRDMHSNPLPFPKQQWWSTGMLPLRRQDLNEYSRGLEYMIPKYGFNE